MTLMIQVGATMTNKDGEGFHIGYELFRWGNRVDGELDNGHWYSWDADAHGEFDPVKGEAVLNVEYEYEEDGQLEKYLVTWERVE